MSLKYTTLTLTHLFFCGFFVMTISGEIYTSMELMKESIIKLQGMEFYADLQEIMVKFVMHFEINETMTIQTKHGEKKMHRDEDILKFDEFLIHSTVYIEHMRKKVNDVTYRYDYPINAFQFIFTHTVLLDKIIQRMLSTFTTYDDLNRIAIIEKLQKKSRRYPFPTHTVLKGATDMILELQDFYLLKASDIATGNSLLGDGTEILTASECFHIAEYATSVGKAYEHLSWLEAAKDQLTMEEDQTVSENSLYSQLYEAYTSAECQCMSEAVKVWEKLVTLHPGNIKKYPNKSSTCGSDKNQESCKQKLINKSSKNHLDDADSQPQNSKHLSDIDLKFQKICKRSIENQSKIIVTNGKHQQKLFCYHERTNDFFYHLLPFKVEVLNANPRIILVHQILSKADQRFLIHEAKNSFLTVTDEKENEILKTENRVRSRSVILQTGNKNNKILSLQNKISAITNRDKQNFEKLYFTNYGVGGYNKLNKNFKNEEILQLQISLILFLNNIGSGGNTVFPELNIDIKPMERAALFVFNSKSKLTGSDITITGSDITTFGSCPVITGNKWIATQTIG